MPFGKSAGNQMPTLLGKASTQLQCIREVKQSYNYHYTINIKVSTSIIQLAVHCFVVCLTPYRLDRTRGCIEECTQANNYSLLLTSSDKAVQLLEKRLAFEASTCTMEKNYIRDEVGWNNYK